jgi:hypothetical protein
MPPRKKYSTPAPMPTDVAKLVSTIRKEFDMDAGFIIIFPVPELVHVVAELCEHTDHGIEVLAQVIEVATVADLTLMPHMYRAMYRIYLRASEIWTDRQPDPEDDTPW